MIIETTNRIEGDEANLGVLVTEDRVEIVGRIVSFELSKDHLALKAEEECDNNFSVMLSKSDVKLLIDGLQDLYKRMEAK